MADWIALWQRTAECDMKREIEMNTRMAERKAVAEVAAETLRENLAEARATNDTNEVAQAVVILLHREAIQWIKT